MPPRRRPRSWLAGRLRSAAGAVQRLAGRVDNTAAEPERPADVPRRLGEPPQHWVDLVAAHAPGLLRELDPDLDLDPVPPIPDRTPPVATPLRRRDSFPGPVGHAARPLTGRTDRPTAAGPDRVDDPYPRAQPDGADAHALHGPASSGPGDPDGRSDRRLPVIRPAAPIGAESSSGTAHSHGSEWPGGRDASASGGTPFAEPAAAHLEGTVATPATRDRGEPTPAPSRAREILDGFDPSTGALPPRSTVDLAVTRHGRAGGRMGGLSRPDLPDEPDRRGRLGEHPADGQPQPDAGQQSERHSGQFPGRFPEHHASWLPGRRQTGRPRPPEGAAPQSDQYAALRHGQHARPERDQPVDTPHVVPRRGGAAGQWDGPPGYGTGVAEVDGGGRWPASAVFPSTAVGPDVDPWPALPDDGPLWTVPGAALDAGHERRLDREQAGG
ncbi:hypothetical protein ACTFTM_17315 [Micromonospora sp. RB23]